MLIKLAKERVSRNELVPSEEAILSIVVKKGEVTGTDIIKKSKTSKSFVSKTVNNLLKRKLIKVRKHGKNNYYTPALDAIIAYGDD
ncbi:MAG: BlaI/MecI/CopY family transcriptional regulator [Gammaproteobacteria bacterium]|jgi:uncharacterized membrane protein